MTAEPELSGLIADPSGSEPLYRQIAGQIAARIESGAMPPGHRLPASRALARALATHRNTVVRAYEDLEESGHVTSVVGRGTFVSERAPTASAQPGASPQGLPWSSLMSQAARAEPLGRFDRLARVVHHADTINLGRMQPPDDLLPAPALRRAVSRVLDRLGGAALGYAPRDGVPRLREVIAERLVARGIPARGDDVIVTTGSQQALDLVARALIDPGDAFGVEAATYAGVLNVLAAAGARLVGIPSDVEGPRLDTLDRLGRRGAKGLYLMPNCHNPTCATISVERRRALCAWSREHGVPILEDDFAADLDLDGVPPPVALRALDGEVIYAGTFSKKLIPALRVGFVVCPGALRPRLVPLKHAMDLGTSALLQYALVEIIERRYLDTHLARVIPVYRERRDALAQALRDHLPDELAARLRVPDRGLALWLGLPDAVHAEQAYHEARRAGVLVSPSTLNTIAGTSGGGLRLTYCSEPPERLREGARRLAVSLSTLAAPARGAGREPTPSLSVV